MDDQASHNESDGAEQPTQFSLRSVFIVTTWASLWLGAWVVMKYGNQHHINSPLLGIAVFVVIYTIPYAVFGYMVGRWKLGIVVGLVFSAMFIFLLIVSSPLMH